METFWGGTRRGRTGQLEQCLAPSTRFVAGVSATCNDDLLGLGWPDTTAGLYALKKDMIVGALSNGNTRLLIDMAKFTDLPWDFVFSSELFGSFKPLVSVLSLSPVLSVEFDAVTVRFIKGRLGIYPWSLSIVRWLPHIHGTFTGPRVLE